MVVVDASVWVSRLVATDVHHPASRLWLEQLAASGGRMVVPVLLLTEVAGAISLRTGEPRLAHQAVASLLRLPTLHIVPIDRRLGEAAARLAADLGLRGADAVYVAVAERLSVPLITWDQEQLDKTSKIIEARSPATAVT